jgi:thiol-disulfide isomerase/thioredoxin
MRGLFALAVSAMMLWAGCGDEPMAANAVAAAPTEPDEVGYDIRRLRPRNSEPLATMFDRMATHARAEGKHVAVLFSADWCEPCRMLELELGNMHPASEIGHVRILEMKEEDWEAATRMNEFNELRRRWSAPLDVYPLFVLLDEKGNKIEDMTEAKDRLEHEGRPATIPNWFSALRS